MFNPKDGYTFRAWFCDWNALFEKWPFDSVTSLTEWNNCRLEHVRGSGLELIDPEHDVYRASEGRVLLTITSGTDINKFRPAVEEFFRIVSSDQNFYQIEVLHNFNTHIVADCNTLVDQLFRSE